MRSLAGAAFATIQDYPSIAAGSCAFLVAFALVSGNALFGQPGGHPDPIWATRDAVTTQSVGQLAPKVPVHTVQTETFLPSVIPVPSRRPTFSNEPVADKGAEVREAQQLLAGLGLYRGKVDGVFGPVTRDAIVTFERANGLEVDGEVSLALLDEIRALTNRTEISATQAKFEEPQSRPEPLPAVAKEAPTVTPVSVVSVPESEEDIARSARIARIQIGLMNFGEAGIAVDGVLGPHTVEAIRSFQERYGLQVSGEPDEAVIHKLEQIGALHNS